MRTHGATPLDQPTLNTDDRLAGHRLFFAVFVPLAVLFLVTATWSPPYDADTFTNAVTAHELGTRGDVVLDRHEQLAQPNFQGVVSWIVEARDSAASQYPPGAALLAAPLYAVWPGDSITWGRTVNDVPVVYEVPPIAPAAIAAALATAAGVAGLAMAMRRLLGSRDALIAAYAAALTTGIWSVAADKLWLHSGDVFYLGVGMWLSARHQLASGLALGMAVATRPHTLLIGVGAALGRALDVKSWRPAVRIGAVMAACVAGLIVFNAIVFDNPSITGGYRIRPGNVARGDSFSLFTNLWGGFFDLSRGLFPFSPFLVVLVPGLPAAWKRAPHWVRGAALGGLGYFLVQLASNRFSGGSGFWGYRYPIEMLVAMTPLLALAYHEWVAPRARVNRVFMVLLAISAAIHLAGAVRCAQYLC